MVAAAAGKFRRLDDAVRMSAYLVHPDGYVGYRAHLLRLDA
jgi:hypothetical protein